MAASKSNERQIVCLVELLASVLVFLSVLYTSILIKMGKRGERKDSSNSDASSEEYVVEKVLNKRIVKGKVNLIFSTGLLRQICFILNLLLFIR